jgi:DNA-binding NarL/FixJ family response regulator
MRQSIVCGSPAPWHVPCTGRRLRAMNNQVAAKAIRVLLAEDHTLVRAGIRSLLESMDQVQVVAETSDGGNILHLVRTHQPDVVLMGISMPKLNGLEVTARVAREFPKVRVVILSMHASEEYVWQALRAGAIGYVVKEADAAELEIAIRSAVQGRTYLSPSVSQHVVADYVRPVGAGPQADHLSSGPFDILTPRQRETLQLIAEGRSTKEIAQTLKLSIKTVETHRAQLMDRLDIHHVPGLVRYAIRTGLIRPED